jgi:hypothetical protein
MAITVSLSSSIRGESLDFEIYQITEQEKLFMESQGLYVAIDLSINPHIIEVRHKNKFERLIVNEKEVLAVIKRLIVRGEVYEEYETCHELLKIQKMILND